MIWLIFWYDGIFRFSCFFVFWLWIGSILGIWGVNLRFSGWVVYKEIEFFVGLVSWCLFGVFVRLENDGFFWLLGVLFVFVKINVLFLVGVFVLFRRLVVFSVIGVGGIGFVIMLFILLVGSIVKVVLMLRFGWNFFYFCFFLGLYFLFWMIVVVRVVVELYCILLSLFWFMVVCIFVFCFLCG